MIEKTRQTAFRLPRPALQQLKIELANVVLSATTLLKVDRWFARWEADPRLLVTRATSQEMGGHGPSHQIDLEKKDEKDGGLEAILLDGQRRITTDSIYRRLILKTIESYPADGPPKKARKPPSAHKPKPSLRHGGARANASPPPHVQERAAASPSAKRGRTRKRIEQPVPSPAE